MENLSSASIEVKNKTKISFTETYDEHADVNEIVIFSLLGLLIIFGNVTSILVFWRRRFFLKRSTIFLINLTTADLMVGIVAIYTILEHILPQDINESIIGDVYFKINVAFDVFAGLSSIFFLTAISMEKVHAVLRPLRHVVIPTCYYVIGVCSVWLLAGFLSALTLLSLQEYLNEQVLTVVISVFIGLALLITCVSYVTIWVKFSRRSFVPRTAATEMNKKLLTTLFTVTVLSLVSWLPVHIIFIFLRLFPNIPISDTIVVATRLLQFANSFLNPIVYNLRMPEFRKATMNLICGCVVTDSPNVEIRLMSME